MHLLRTLLPLVAVLVCTVTVQAQQVARAVYGARGNNIDVTNVIQQAVASGQGGIRISNESMGGDPVPGQAKTLVITYRTGRGNVTQSGREGTYLRFNVGRADRGDYDRGDRGDRGDYRPRPNVGDVIGGAIAEGIIEGFDAGPRAELKFRNRTDQTLTIYAFDRYGNWRWVSSLQPGARYTTPAAPGQSFIVNDEYNRTIKRVRASRGTLSVSIP